MKKAVLFHYFFPFYFSEDTQIIFLASIKLNGLFLEVYSFGREIIENRQFIMSKIKCNSQELLRPVVQYTPKSIDKVEGVRYPENAREKDDVLISYIWAIASWGVFEKGTVLLLSLTIFLL